MSDKLKALLAAPDAQCTSAVDALDNAFEQQKGSSRTLCDQRAAQGAGVRGEELISKTQARLVKISALLKDTKGNSQVCVAKRTALVGEVTAWRDDRDKLCNAPSAATERGPSRTPDDREATDAGMPSLETTLLRGTAEFFEARAQAEAKLFAYEVVTDHICQKADDDEEADSKLLKVRDFLVDTCELFDNDDDLAATPATIQQTVRADLEQLPARLVAKIADPKLQCGTALAWSFSKEAVEGSDVLDLLSSPDLLLADPLVQPPTCTQDVHDKIKLLASELKVLLSGDRTAVERMVKAGQVERAVFSRNTARGINGNLDELGQVLKKVLLRVRVLDQANQAWKKDPNPKTRAAVVVAGLRTVEPILTYALHADDAKDPKVTKSLGMAIDLTGELINREYAAAVVTGAELATTAGLKNGKVRNLLGLAAGLAQAESSDDVRATLEDAALPLGSWRRKDEKRVGMTLTGLVGVQLAHEVVVQKSARGGDVKSGATVAPSLLVGADVHGGLGRGIRLGLQVSVLDLGALLSYRLNHAGVKAEPNSTEQEQETADQQPEVRAVQVLSPGLYPYIGLGPFDVGAGVSFVPALRSVSGAGSSDALDVMRVGGFVAVDVSVLPLL